MNNDSNYDGYRDLVTRSIEKIVDEYEQEEFEDILSDLEEENPDYNIKIETRLPLPKPDDVVIEVNGTIYCNYIEDEWLIPDPVTPFSISFGKDFETAGIFVSSNLTKQLHEFIKLNTWFWVPGKNPYVSINSMMSIQYGNRIARSLAGFFFSYGYLIGNNKNIKTIDSVNAVTLRNEIIKRIAENISISSVVMFVNGICNWVRLTQIAALPKEMEASFSLTELFDKSLNEMLAKYYTANMGSLSAIDFEDLGPMLKKANKYVVEFSNDIIFLNNAMIEVKKLGLRRGQKANYTIFNRGLTKSIFDKVKNKEYINDGETGKPWASHIIADDAKIYHKPVFKEIYNLECSSIFLLLLWTAMRRRELLMLEANALVIDGAQITNTEDLMELVNKGTKFNLLKLISKTKKNIIGGYDIIPIPKIAAQAFAILIELQKVFRDYKNSDRLIIGKRTRSACNDNNIISSASGSTLRSRLNSFCDLAGVKKYSLHPCRKTLATLLINHNPASIEFIMDLLGHHSIAMTRRYLMSLPGVCKDLKHNLLKFQQERVIEFMSDAAQGHVAGDAGNRALNAVKRNPEAFKGVAIPRTINVLLNALVEQSNFTIMRTPMAWCLKFMSKVRWDAPCLPLMDKNSFTDVMTPNYDKCVPHLCKYAGHTRSDLSRANRNLRWSKNSASNASSRDSKAYFKKIELYWDEVTHQLQYGRDDIVQLHIAEHALSISEIKS